MGTAASGLKGTSILTIHLICERIHVLTFERSETIRSVAYPVTAGLVFPFGEDSKQVSGLELRREAAQQENARRIDPEVHSRQHIKFFQSDLRITHGLDITWWTPLGPMPVEKRLPAGGRYGCAGWLKDMLRTEKAIAICSKVVKGRVLKETRVFM